MGDAVRDGDVHAELDDTIDAAPRSESTQPSSQPVPVMAATRDYRELAQVERHHYVITREIARGGIGRVFEARDLRLGRQVAIKELLPKNRDAARRFEREARITSRLQHPAIIHVYEAGIWPGGEPFYAMPLVSGRSLDKVVYEKKTLADRLGLLPNVIAVADALAYAHNANVIHRDLKPANVLVGEFGETVVIDWGLAKDIGASSDPKESLHMRLRATAEETVSGSVVGTPAYMPPEQARGDAVDQRADVYALGALLYKLLVGAPPYLGENAKDVLDKVKAGPPVPVQVREPAAPPDLVAIVTKAMARNPDDRYITASELAADLKRFETGQLVGAHRYTIGELVKRWLRRHRVAVSIGAAALVALIVLGLFSIQQIVAEKEKAERARDEAEGARDDAHARRARLLEERGRAELRAGHAGAALAYLVGAAEDGVSGGARGFLIADAMRPFQAEIDFIKVGDRAGDVAVAVSPDGKLVATAGDGPIELRPPGGGTPARSFGRFGVTRVVAFDPTSTRLAAAGDDGVARVWSVDGAELAVLRGHSGRILDVVFGPDGRTLVTTGVDRTARLWDVATQTATVSECPHSAPIVAARFSPDGKLVVTAGEDGRACVFRAVAVPDPPSTQLLPKGSVRKELRGHTKALNAVAWSPDGTYIVTASDDGTAIVWNSDRGKPALGQLHHEPGALVETVAVSHDGRLVVTAGTDQTVLLWTLPGELPEDGTPPPAPRPKKLIGHTARVVQAEFSRDDRQLITGGFDTLVKIWDVASQHEVATLEHGDVVTSIAFVPGAQRLASGSRDGAARIWNTKVSEVRPDLDSAINAIAIASDGAVAAGLDDHLVRIVREDKTLVLEDHVGSVFAVAFTPNGTQLISAGADPAAIVWDARDGKKLHTFGDHAEPIQAIAVAPDGERVAMVVDGKIEVWSLSRRTQLRTLAVPGGHIDALAISPLLGTIVGVGADGTLAAWDRHGQLTTRITGEPGRAVAFTPRGDALVVAGEGAAHVRTVIGHVIGKVDVRLEAGMGNVNSVLFAADGALVITGGDNGRALIWDRYKGKLLAERDRHDQPITSIAVHGDTLWIASEDHTLSAWGVRVETGSVASLNQFMLDKHVPVELVDDVVRKRSP